MGFAHYEWMSWARAELGRFLGAPDRPLRPSGALRGARLELRAKGKQLALLALKLGDFLRAF